MEYRITCIFKAVTEDSFVVTHIGGVDAQGERWTMSVEEAAEQLAAGDRYLLDEKPLAGIDPESKQLLKLPSCP
jgi:ABC-type lipopolysaccharide export system ATPase subunit